MGVIKQIGSITGSISGTSTLSGRLTIPYGMAEDHEIYSGEYTITPTDEDQILPTANKILEKDILVEASSYVIPEGTEMASDEDIDSIIDSVFGTEEEDSDTNSDSDDTGYNSDDVATDEELKDVIEDVFG